MKIDLTCFMPNIIGKEYIYWHKHALRHLLRAVKMYNTEHIFDREIIFLKSRGPNNGYFSLVLKNHLIFVVLL